MPSFIKSRAKRGFVGEYLILPGGRIVAEHAADEGVSALELAQSLSREKLSGYILMRDTARTRQGIIMLIRGSEAGTLLQMGHENFTGPDAAKHIVGDHPAVGMALSAHALSEPVIIAASTPLTGVRLFYRLTTAALKLPLIVDHWQHERMSGLLWAGDGKEGVAVYFYEGNVLGEIERGGSKLVTGFERLVALWGHPGCVAEGFVVPPKEL